MNVESMAQFLSGFNNLAILISLLISLLIAISGVIPSVFVTGANILIFGPIKGFIISLLGEVLGAWVTFYLYRFGFKKKAESLGKNHKLVQRIIDSTGIKAGLLVMQGRLIPFIPSGFITLAASISNIPIRYFILGTFIGKIPSILIEALVSVGLLSIEQTWIKLALTIIAIIGSYFIIRKKD